MAARRAVSYALPQRIRSRTMTVPHATRFGLAAALVAAFAMPADARVDPRGMSCAQATATVQNAGSVVMTTGQFTFATIVATPGACRATSSRRQPVPTRDNPQCMVGFVCLPRTGGNR